MPRRTDWGRPSGNPSGLRGPAARGPVHPVAAAAVSSRPVRGGEVETGRRAPGSGRRRRRAPPAAPGCSRTGRRPRPATARPPVRDGVLHRRRPVAVAHHLHRTRLAARLRRPPCPQMGTRLPIGESARGAVLALLPARFPEPCQLLGNGLSTASVAERSVGTLPNVVNAIAAVFTTGPKLIPLTRPPAGGWATVVAVHAHRRRGSRYSTRHGTIFTSQICDQAVPASAAPVRSSPQPRPPRGRSRRAAAMAVIARCEGVSIARRSPTPSGRWRCDCGWTTMKRTWIGRRLSGPPCATRQPSGYLYMVWFMVPGAYASGSTQTLISDGLPDSRATDTLTPLAMRASRSVRAPT